MNIVVCIKQVPDTNEVKLDPVKGTLIRDGVPSIMNPDDKAGLEMALRLKEQAAAKVTVLSMGPPQAEEVLREALAMGADEAYLISDRRFGGADTWATSQTLAAALKKINYDLIITGRQAIDGDTAQVGPELAEHLGIPCASYAESIELQSASVIVQRQLDERIQKITMQLPALLTALGEAVTPRYMTPGGIFAAYRSQTINLLTRDDLEVEDSNIGLAGSPTRVFRSFPKSVKAPGMKVETDVEQSVEFIMAKLQAGFKL